MSERELGFIKRHKKAEVAAAAGIVAAGAAIGAASFMRRRRRHHELHTFSGADMTERLKIFAFEDETDLSLNLPTRIVGALYSATLNGSNDGLSKAEIESAFLAAKPKRLQETLQLLKDAAFIEEGLLNDGHEGYKVTSDLVEAVLDGGSQALSQYFYGSVNG